MESVLSSYTHGHGVLLSEEKLLNSWDRLWFSLLPPSLFVHRERRHLHTTALPQELRDPEKRPGPCSER